MKLKIKKDVRLYCGYRVFTAGVVYDFQMCTDGWKVVDDLGSTQYFCIETINELVE